MFCLGEKKVAGMLSSDRLRDWLSSNLAPIVFLIAYFFTVVLGSFMYLLPSARPYLEVARFTSRIFEFDTLFSAGYWLLLIAPFIVTPLVVWGVRRVAGRPLARLIDFFPEFTRTSYLTLLLLCYAIVLCSFWKADAFNLFLAGGDFSSSVEARFIIRERVSFFSMAVLMSNLHFLAIYAAVKWVREGGWWWGGVTALNAVVISALLICLNMKWPIIIFYAGIVMALFVYTRRYPFVKTAAGTVVLLLVCFMISAFVYRLSSIPAPASAQVPETTPAKMESAPSKAEELVAVVPHSVGEDAKPEASKELKETSSVKPNAQAKEIRDAQEASISIRESKAAVTHAQPSVAGSVGLVVTPDVPVTSEKLPEIDGVSTTVDNEPQANASAEVNVVKIGESIGGHVPMMMFHAVNRMAIIYPYYYEIFTNKGQVCGGLLAQAQVGQKCRPSYYIYTEMFNDQFNGRGTAPAAVHITAYALGGWPLAWVGLICGSILLGVFAALPLASSSLVGAMAITGGVLGYHLSQLPGEGPLFYDHGVFWTVLMLVGYAVFVKIYRLVAR